MLASVCERRPDQQRGSVLEVDIEQQVCAQKLKKLAQTCLKASFHHFLSRVPDLCMWELILPVMTYKASGGAHQNEYLFQSSGIHVIIK